jgi:transposase
VAEVVNAIFYVAQTGGQRRMLPRDLPPFITVPRHFRVSGTTGCRLTISHALRIDARERRW